MATDPFSSAITGLSAAWRPRSGNVGNFIWGGGPDAVLGVSRTSYGVGAPDTSVGLAGWGYGLNRGSATYNRSMGWWNPQPQQNYTDPTGALTGSPSLTPGGQLGAASGEFGVLNQYDQYFQKAAQQFGLPANALKAIAMIERGWEGSGISPSGAVGIMQVMPQYWGDKGYDIYSTEGNIMAGALAYKSFYDQYKDEAMARGVDPYEAAARAYLAGNPWSTASDYYGTTTDIYGQRFNQYVNQLGGTAGGAAATGGGQGVAAIWGGQGDYPITQDMGLTDFARGNPLYDYARAYHGFEGHPGLDVGTPAGTALYTPVSGTVVFGGGSGYYANRGNAGPGVGEFRIRLDNGDELILGHMQQITVQPGQRLSAGAFVGYSGSENGDHVHVEYRQSDGQGGFYIADPRQVLGNVSFTGGGSSAPVSGGYGGNWWDRWYQTGAVR